jgi:endonuclease/exonuclease/phosphatase family metal-dependent hydrolase
MILSLLYLVVRVFPMLLVIVTVFGLRSVYAQMEEGRSDSLLECGVPRQVVEVAPGAEIRIVSYNIRWRSGKELAEIVAWLKDRHPATPAIIGLQEIDRDKERSGKRNNARAIADGLGMYYAWAAPGTATADKKKADEEETGVEILSPYPLTNVTRIVLPNAGPGGRQRVAIGATTMVGNTAVRVYSVHSETRLTIAKKIEQLRAVLTDLDRLPKGTPAVVLGDFNTWELPAVEGTRKLFTEAGFITPLPDDESTFYRKALMFDVKLKLDWIWLRGFTPQSYGIDRKLTVSDHFPLWTVVKLRGPSSAN